MFGSATSEKFFLSASCRLENSLKEHRNAWSEAAMTIFIGVTVYVSVLRVGYLGMEQASKIPETSMNSPFDVTVHVVILLHQNSVQHVPCQQVNKISAFGRPLS